MRDVDGDDAMNRCAVRSFCEPTAAVGDRILAADFPGGDCDRAEWFRQLADQRRRSGHVAWRNHT
jgi:hypothetical protein